MITPLRLTAICRLAVCFTFACGAIPAFAASFDCKKAGTGIEHAICNTPALNELDGRIDNYYVRAMADLPVGQASALRTEQRAWLKKRNACANNSGDLKACLEPIVKARATALEDIHHRAASDFDAAVSLIPDSPVNAADKLRQYQTPLASAWLVYLNHFVPTSGVTAQEAYKYHQMALEGLRDDDFAYSVMKDIDSDPKESADRKVLTLLRMNIERVDYQYDDDDDRPYVHCFIFKAHGDVAYTAFGGMYGSSRDGSAPVCKPQDVIFDNPAWTTLDNAFSDVLAKVSQDAGTIQYASYADWRIFDLHVTVAPEDYLTMTKKPGKNESPVAEIQNWKDEKIWPKAQRERALAAIEPARKATAEWLQNDLGWTAENGLKGADNIVNQWLADRMMFIDGSGWTGE